MKLEAGGEPSSGGKKEAKEEPEVAHNQDGEATKEPALESQDTELPQTNGVDGAVPPAQEDKRSIVQRYTDLQAKHHAEVNDLLRRQKAEVERLLAGHCQ